MPSAGLRTVCPYCGNADIVPDLNKKGGLCKDCGKRSAEFLQMRWAAIPAYRRSLKLNAAKRKFSIYRCDEVHAIMLILIAALLLVFFIYIVS